MRKNHPIQPAPGWQVTEVLTPGMKVRFFAEGPSRTYVTDPISGSRPMRKSYNSAAADTHRGAR